MTPAVPMDTIMLRMTDRMNVLLIELMSFPLARAHSPLGCIQAAFLENVS